MKKLIFTSIMTLFLAPQSSFANISYIEPIFDSVHGATYLTHDCSFIGTWNESTKTCTMNRSIEGRIEITERGTTLDGGNNTLSPVFENEPYGIYILNTDSVTVKNMSVDRFLYAITSDNSSATTISNTVLASMSGEIQFFNSPSITIKENRLVLSAYGSRYGIIGLNSDNALIQDNFVARFFGNEIAESLNFDTVSRSTIQRNSFAGGDNGVVLSNSSDNTFRRNNISGSFSALTLSNDSLRNTFSQNDFANAENGVYSTLQVFVPCTENCGIFVSLNTIKSFFVSSTFALSDDDNIFFRNTFSDNVNDVTALSSDLLRFNTFLPDGGNVWSKNTECTDTNHDNLCDMAPYIVNEFFTDNFPRKSITLVAPQTFTASETEDDGKQDGKGVADQTQFTFTSTAPNTVLWTNDETVIKSYSLTNNTLTTTFPKGHYSYHYESGAQRFPLSGELSLTTGYSNVAFLPGLEASRLSDSQGSQVWTPPAFIHNNSILFMNPDGTPVTTGIYATEIIDEALTANIYKSFMSSMDTLVSEKTIHDWQPFPYDWRYSVEDTVNNATIQKMTALADTSDTGKVTLIAHSNGGLVAKVLTSKIDQNIIDQMIFVAVPEAGTPQAIGAILHGYDQGLPKDWFPLLINKSDARTLAVNMPSAYGLLPSTSYFTSVHEPVIAFSNDPLLADWRAKYGSSIDSNTALRSFMTDQTRTTLPTSNPLTNPLIANDFLFGNSILTHNMLDTWAPPQGVELTQIAGWGEDTLKTIEYYQGVMSKCVDTKCSRIISTPKLEYKMNMTVDGDGTVVVPSALWTGGVGRYWVNLKAYNINNFLTVPLGRQHADILEPLQIRTFIQNLIVRNSSSLPSFVSTISPVGDASKRLHFTLHSPLTLDLYDDAGNHTGVNPTTGLLEENIPDSRYLTFGEVQYISVKQGANLHIKMNAIASGSFTLDMEEVSNNTTTASSTFAGVPSATSTIATIDIPFGDISKASPLSVDENGDGVVDFTLTSKLGEVVLPDFTPPEMTLIFANNQVIIGSNEKAKIETTKSKISITDEAGNTLVIPLLKSEMTAKEFEVSFDTLIYNGVSTKIQKVSLEYEWELKNGTVKELKQEIEIQKWRKVEAEYNREKNQTKIEDGKTKITKNGLVPLTFTTSNGIIEVKY